MMNTNVPMLPHEIWCMVLECCDFIRTCTLFRCFNTELRGEARKRLHKLFWSRQHNLMRLIIPLPFGKCEFYKHLNLYAKSLEFFNDWKESVQSLLQQSTRIESASLLKPELFKVMVILHAHNQSKQSIYHCGQDWEYVWDYMYNELGDPVSQMIATAFSCKFDWIQHWFEREKTSTNKYPISQSIMCCYTCILNIIDHGNITNFEDQIQWCQYRLNTVVTNKLSLGLLCTILLSIFNRIYVEFDDRYKTQIIASFSQALEDNGLSADKLQTLTESVAQDFSDGAFDQKKNEDELDDIIIELTPLSFMENLETYFESFLSSDENNSSLTESPISDLPTPPETAGSISLRGE